MNDEQLEAIRERISIGSTGPERELMAEVERLRRALEKIARKATQSIDTTFDGRLLHEIEVMARAALETGAMSDV